MTIRVLFVCLGNICRSPTAHGIFQGKVERAGLSEQIIIDSAGTGDWHIGHAPDKRAQASALQRGYDMSELRARQVSVADFSRYDYVLAMDQKNLEDLRAMKPDDYQGTLDLFLSAAGIEASQEVPDPYYEGDDHFDKVFDLIEQASDQLLCVLQTRHLLSSAK